jgi:hypothetical protein
MESLQIRIRMNKRLRYEKMSESLLWKAVKFVMC